MAVPKYRTSRSKRNSRRAQNSKMKIPCLSVCSHCDAKILSHRVCPQCGYYKGVQVIEIETY